MTFLTWIWDDAAQISIVLMGGFFYIQEVMA